MERRGDRVTAFLANGLRIEARQFIWAGSPDGMKELDGLSDLTPPLLRGAWAGTLSICCRRMESWTRGAYGLVRGALSVDFPCRSRSRGAGGIGLTDQDLERREERWRKCRSCWSVMACAWRGSPRWIVQRHATHLQTPAFEAARPASGTQAENLPLCGLAAHGLPLPMESALPAPR